MVIDSTISESDPRPNIFDFLLRRSNNENLKSIFRLTKDLSQIGGLHECLKREHLVASSNGLYCKLKMLHFHWLIQKWRQRAINLLELRRMFELSFVIILFMMICDFERFYFDFAKNFLSTSANRSRIFVISFICIVNIFILRIQNHRIDMSILIFCIFYNCISF